MEHYIVEYGYIVCYLYIRNHREVSESVYWQTSNYCVSLSAALAIFADFFACCEILSMRNFIQQQKTFIQKQIQKCLWTVSVHKQRACFTPTLASLPPQKKKKERCTRQPLVSLTQGVWEANVAIWLANIWNRWWEPSPNHRRLSSKCFGWRAWQWPWDRVKACTWLESVKLGL